MFEYRFYNKNGDKISYGVLAANLTEAQYRAGLTTSTYSTVTTVAWK